MKKVFIIIISLFLTNNLLADNTYCGNLDKLSKDYTKCLAEKSKKKGKSIKDKINANLEKSGLKEKYKKYNSKKTLKDLFKKQ